MVGFNQIQNYYETDIEFYYTVPKLVFQSPNEAGINQLKLEDNNIQAEDIQHMEEFFE